MLLARQAFALLLISFFAFFQQVVIEPTTFMQCLVELLFLALGWIDAKLKHLTHTHIMSLNTTFVKQGAAIHPPSFS